MMRVLVTGGQGQLARCLADAAAGDAALDMVFAARPDFDLGRVAAARDHVIAARPDIIVNAAAYTAVDKAESEPELAFAINRDGAAAMAEAADKLGVPIIHLSTDYVFSGEKNGAYVETDSVAPMGVYGHSKLAGEHAVAHSTKRHLIVRTAWVYSAYGANFVKTMMRLGRDRTELRVVDDQTGNPTSAHDLATTILAMCKQADNGNNAWGTYHAAGQGDVTWHGFAKQIFATLESLGHAIPKLTAITTRDYPTPAKRPANSRLDCAKLNENFGLALPDWKPSTAKVVSRLLAERGT